MVPWNLKVLYAYMALLAETCATIKISTVAGYHVMLAVLLFVKSEAVHKKNVCCTPTYPLLTPLPKTFLALLENKKTFFCPIFIRKSRFSHYGAMKEKHNMKTCFPTYLPNQKIQGMCTVSKQCFKDGLMKVFLKGQKNFKYMYHSLI